MSDLKAIFPHLADAEYRETSPEDEFYNCIAFAAGDDSQKWWPNDAPGAYWPIEREETLENFVKAFGTLGYEPCESGAHEPGVEKLAIYTNSGEPTHMARQLPSGRWTSKLGDLEDIEHETLDQISGDGKYDYGRVALFLRRAQQNRQG